MKREVEAKGKASAKKEARKTANAEGKADEGKMFPLLVRAKGTEFNDSTTVEADKQEAFSTSIHNILKLIFLKQNENQETILQKKIAKSKPTAANPKSRKSQDKADKNKKNKERRSKRKSLKKEEKKLKLNKKGSMQK